LYFYHFGEILGNDASVDVSVLRGISDEAYEFTKDLPQNEIGGSSLIYKYGRTEDEPKTSLWVFQFYERHWVMVTTERIDA
jgi:hypothetical protein